MSATPATPPGFSTLTTHERIRFAVTLGLAFLMAATLVPRAIMSATHSLGLSPGRNVLDMLPRMEQRLISLSESASRPGLHRIAYLGDSTVVAIGAEANLPRRLQRELRVLTRGEIDFEVVSLAFPAMGDIGYYFLADAIAAARPDFIVWQTSFTHLARRWRTTYSRSEYSSWISLWRLPEALVLPLHQVGLTVDELLLYQAIWRLDGIGAWSWLRSEQSRMDKLRERLEHSLGAYTGTRPEKRFRRRAGMTFKSRNLQSVDGRPRYSAAMERKHYGGALSGLDAKDPTLQLMGAALRCFRDSGIPVVLYLNPINVDHLDGVGVLDRDELSRSASTIGSVAEDNGAVFVDLHELFPNEYFRDERGHFRHDAEVDAPGELVSPLGAAVAAELWRMGDR